MLQFKVLKSSFDGISGGESRYDSIEEALQEISFFRGWDSKEQLHEFIRKWAAGAIPGSVYTTQVSAIVAIGVGPALRGDGCLECGSEEVEYSDMEPVEDGYIEQEGLCLDCGERWKDVFVLAERRKLAKHV